MATVIATVTNQARAYWAQFFGNGLNTFFAPWSPEFLYFKIGRGGWINPGSGPVPRVPDPTLSDLDIIQNGPSGTATRYTPTVSSGGGPNGNIYFLQKSLVSANFSFIAPTTLQIRCILDFTDFNDIQGVPSNPPGGPTNSPLGINPQLWELGVFSPPPPGYTSPTVAYGSENLLMVMYGTFNLETKTSAIQLENDVQITF